MQYLVDIRKFQNIEKDKDLMWEISYTLLMQNTSQGRITR